MSPRDYEKGETMPKSHSHSSPVSSSGDDPSKPEFKPLAPSELNTSAFAGRLGGGQQYTLTSKDGIIGDESPDAYRDASWSAILSLRGFIDPMLWRMAIIEGVATSTQVLLSAYLGVGLVPVATKVSAGAVVPVALASLAQVFLVGLFVWGLGASTGAHLNPLITMGTLGARLCSLPRAILYIGFQCVGAVIAGWILRGALGTGTKGVEVIPGCFADPALISPGEAYAFEASTAFFSLFLAFGLGLDPRVSGSLSPALSPLLIGITSALTIFCTGFSKPGYLGAATNPARCLGLMTASRRFNYHYIHWVGDFTAVLLNSALYALLPPYALRKR